VNIGHRKFGNLLADLQIRAVADENRFPVEIFRLDLFDQAADPVVADRQMARDDPVGINKNRGRRPFRVKRARKLPCPAEAKPA
jgi:hypothetical protein